MKRMLPVTGILAGLAALTGLVWLVGVGLLSANSSQQDRWVEVSITNLTRGQVLSPVFMAVHHRDAGPLYALGQPASEALAKMAEDADASELLSEWDPDANDDVIHAGVFTLDGGPIPPGETISTHFEVAEAAPLLSFASMLVTTNDAFIGAGGLDMTQSRTVLLNAYDAGSEANSENCAFIPGPPCGNHARDDAESEGFIHVHAGIHGGKGSDLDPATHDWRDPVARLTIRSWTLAPEAR